MANKELFKPIPGHEGVYEVGDNGTVRSLDKIQYRKHPKLLRSHKFNIKGKLLKPYVNKHGYHGVALCNDGERIDYGVHQLVAMAFLGHKVDGHSKVVDHIDNNPGNNSVDNLQIVSTRLNNSKDKKKKHGKYVGVTLSSGNRIKKWQSTIGVNGRNVFLGRYETEEEAKAAYDNYLIENGVA